MDPRLQRALDTHQAGNLPEAERGYLACLEGNRDDATALLYLGVLRYDQRDLDDAIRLMSRSIALQPDLPIAHNHLGLALLARNELADAVSHFETALRLRPGYADALNNLGNANKRLKRYDESARAFDQVLRSDPDNCNVLHNFGLLEFERRQFDAAERHLRRVLLLDPGFHKSRYQLGLLAEAMGKFTEAAEHHASVLRQVPDYFPAMASLLSLRDQPLDDAVIERAERMASRTDLPDPESFTLCYGLAKRFEAREDYERAFRYMRLANERRGRKSGYERDRVVELFRRYMAVFTPEFVERNSVHGSPSERPVFVVGMPRTGTTLTEQILAAHPEICGAGEIEELPKAVNRLPFVMQESFRRPMPAYPDCLESLEPDFMRAMIDYYDAALDSCDDGAARIVDKNPFNFLNVGLIAILFPRARIIHCHRNPLDVGISCYSEIFQLKQDFTTDFGNFAHYYAQYRRLMEHWKVALGIDILDVAYEDLVIDTDRVARAMVAHCGLRWSDQCLSFQRVGRPVLTPSKWQVRQPIYRSSLNRWRNYEAHLGRLRAALLDNGVPA